MGDTDEWHVDVDCSDLRDFDESLYRQLVRYPQVPLSCAKTRGY
jgi:hypothetical protein